MPDEAAGRVRQMNAAVRALRACVAAALVALFFLAAAEACQAAPAAAPPAAKGGWPARQDGADLLIETTNYRIRTDLGMEAGQMIASHQEVLYAELTRRLSGVRSYKSLERLNVLVVSTQAEYLKRLGPTAARSKGIYMPSKDTLAAWGSKDELDVILETLRHEGTHQFMDRFFGSSCPVWLNEGMAVFYEHGRFIGGKLELGDVPTDRVNLIRKALAANKAIPLATLLTMTDEQWLDNVHKGTAGGGASSYMQYCEAWSMVHFLVYAEKGKYQSAFLQYLAFLNHQPPDKDAWNKAFGSDIAGFEKRWREYVTTLKPTGDTEDCRLHLELLGQLLIAAKDRPDVTKDMATFHRAVLDGKFGRWGVKREDGLEIKSTDKKAMESLFHCGLDKKTAGEPSYELAPGKPGGPMVLRCHCHAGLVMETTYEKDKQGDLEVNVVAKPAGSVPAATAPATPAKPVAKASPVKTTQPSP